MFLGTNTNKERVKRKEMKVHKMLAKIHGETNRASRRQAMEIGNGHSHGMT